MTFARKRFTPTRPSSTTHRSSLTCPKQQGARFLAAVMTFLLGSVFIAFAQEAELLLVHALPGDAEATWLVDDEAVGNTGELSATVGFLSVTAGQITLRASVAGAESEAVVVETQANSRYVAYLHAGPGGVPAIITGKGLHFTLRDNEQYARIVNLVPTAENVKSYDSAECDGNRLSAASYGSVGIYRDIDRPFRGPSTLCDDGGILATLGMISPEDGWQIAPATARSIVLIEVDGAPVVLLVEETP